MVGMRFMENGLLLIMRRDGASWEIQVVRRREPWWKRWLRAWREEEQARLLAQLDERTLRDIGLDAGSGNPLAARADAYRQQEAWRIAMARLGLM